MSEEAGVNGTSFSTKMEKGNFFRIRCHSKERVSYDIPIIFFGNELFGVKFVVPV